MKRRTSPPRSRSASNGVGADASADASAGRGDATARTAESLYRPWFDLMPALFGAAPPPQPLPSAAPPAPAAASQADAGSPDAPFPADLMTEALLRTQQMLAPLFHQFAQVLAAGSSTQPHPESLESPVDGHASELMALLAPFEQAIATWPLSTLDHSAGWTEALTRLGHGAAPVMTGVERTFGAVSDALGLAPSREISDAQRTLAAAALERQQARAEYLAVIARIWSAGLRNLYARLSEMAGRGQTVDTMTALIRQWARATDEAAHVALQSDEGLAASVKMIRAATRYRDAAHRLVAIASEAMNVPTRAEVDDAYLHIQELKREVRRLWKSVAALERGAARPPTKPRAPHK